jgi:hypothetical protein
MRMVEMVQVYYIHKHFQKENKCAKSNVVYTADTELSLRDLNHDQIWISVTHWHNLKAVQYPLVYASAA